MRLRRGAGAEREEGRRRLTGAVGDGQRGLRGSTGTTATWEQVGGGKEAGRRRSSGVAAWSPGDDGGWRRWPPPLDPDPIGGEGGIFRGGECRWVLGGVGEEWIREWGRGGPAGWALAQLGWPAGPQLAPGGGVLPLFFFAFSFFYFLSFTYFLFCFNSI